MSLQNYIDRLKQINRNVSLQESRYARRYRYYDSEQDSLHEEEPEGAEDPGAEAFDAQPGGQPAQAQDFTGADGGEQPQGEDPAAAPAPEGGEPAPADGQGDPGAAPAPDMGQDPTMGGAPDPAGDTEIDVTELVNQVQQSSQKSDDILNKMDMQTQNIAALGHSVSSLEGNLQQMQTALNSLSHQVELMRPPTEEERRKVVQQNSYPFNQNVAQANSGQKQTQTDLENKSQKLSMQNILASYNDSAIKDSF